MYFTYEADYHCKKHTTERFGREAIDMIKHLRISNKRSEEEIIRTPELLKVYPKDNEGNLVHVHQGTSHYCSECLYEEIQARDSQKGQDTINDKEHAKERLEHIRGEIDAERISLGEIAELQTLVQYIEPGDVELLQWAGVVERAEDDYTILDSVSFSNGLTGFLMPSEPDACILIVAVKSNMHEPDGPLEWKAYIGVCQGHDGFVDRQNVARLGSELRAREAAGFFPDLDIKQYKK